ncbi:MAG: hypothetical protein GQ582_13505 [Methyloprofundus sp.]|nr:hypothetical protein [Methyloprofundus sp.]
MTKIYPKHIFSRQKGAATLLISLGLIIAITLIAMISAKSVVQETKITANNYRSRQAFAAADAAMTFAVMYFNNGGFDHDGDGYLDASDEEETLGDKIVDVDGEDMDSLGDVGFGFGDGDGKDDILAYYPHLADDTRAISFDNESSRCIQDGREDMQNGLITTVGLSLDGVARRTISQCVAAKRLLKGSGPKQSLVSGSNVGLTGSAQIINRYRDMNIWSAGTAGISGSAMETYLRPSGTKLTDYTKEELNSFITVPKIPDVQKASNVGLGGGGDIYMNDTRLSTAIKATALDIAAGNDGDGCDRIDVDSDGNMDCTFYGLFLLESKKGMSETAAAVGQKFTGGASSSDLDGKTGVIWIEGDASLSSGAVIGAPSVIDPNTGKRIMGKSALVIVSGDFSLSGATIFGVLYVMGDLKVTGSPLIAGTLIIEGVASGAGSLTLVYTQEFGEDGTSAPLIGAGAVTSGSWRDW